jgi:hypothetical protein
LSQNLQDLLLDKTVRHTGAQEREFIGVSASDALNIARMARRIVMFRYKMDWFGRLDRGAERHNFV